jgi:hypothetical protein
MNLKKIATLGLIMAVSTGAVVAVYADASQRGGSVSRTPEGQSIDVLPAFPVNEHGQTYGRSDGLLNPADEPDLILAQATNGKIGYVLKSDLDAATGADVASPEEALAQQAKNRTGEPIEIAVFEADGRTRIGVFVIVPSVGTVVDGG